VQRTGHNNHWIQPKAAIQMPITQGPVKLLHQMMSHTHCTRLARMSRTGQGRSLASTEHRTPCDTRGRRSGAFNHASEGPPLRWCGRRRYCGYDEIIERDRANWDIFWLRDKSLEESEYLHDSDVLAQQIADDLLTARPYRSDALFTQCIELELPVPESSFYGPVCSAASVTGEVSGAVKLLSQLP
jgi:hypothetical protein